MLCLLDFYELICEFWHESFSKSPVCHSRVTAISQRKKEIHWVMNTAHSPTQKVGNSCQQWQKNERRALTDL